MATELKTNGAEYSPNTYKSELSNGNSTEDGIKGRYTKKEDNDGDDERIPLQSPMDPEKGAQPEPEEDVKDAVSVCFSKEKDNKEKCPLRGKERNMVYNSILYIYFRSRIYYHLHG